MDNLGFLEPFVADGYPLASLVGLGLLVLLWVVQMVYHIVAYGRISTYRNPKPSAEAKEVGVSVIVPLFDADFGFLNERLPKLLAQKLKNYEVVLVNVTGDEDFSEQIFFGLPVISLEKTGRFARIVLEGKEDDMKKALEKLSPAIVEQMPMDFEEMFIREVEGRGYKV